MDCSQCGNPLELVYEGSFDNDERFWVCPSCGFERWEFPDEDIEEIEDHAGSIGCGGGERRW